MPDELKKFLSRELEELKQNKIRAIALVVCFVAVLFVWISDDTSGGEEINLSEPTKPPAQKISPNKPLPVEKSPDGVTLVLGANVDELIVADPFAGEDKPKPPPPPQKNSALIPPPQIPLLPPIPQQIKPQEKILLLGTAISDDKKMAMFLRGNETIFLSIGDEINGRKISDINPDFVTFSDGVRVYIQKELN